MARCGSWPLATLLMQPESLGPSVILVDEPELGLHPYAISLFAALVKQAAVKSRVILATQSPILLDHFEPEDVLVTDLVAGQTTFRRLNSDDLEVWLEDLQPGAVVGEERAWWPPRQRVDGAAAP